MNRPIGVLGGIFDPVHNGHLATALFAFNHFNLDKVLFIPAGLPPHKLNSVSAGSEHRCAMLRLALQNHPGALIWENELHHDSVSYTIDTLHEIRSVYPDSPISFIIGADNLLEIQTWHRYTEIISLVTLCVAARPGYSPAIPDSLANATVLFFPSPEWGLSSRMLRSYLAQGLDCRYLLPPPVQEYIINHGLYKETSVTNPR